MTTHNPYFAKLEAKLRTRGYGHPVLVLDLDILDQNIDASLPFFANKNYRVVAKSMPSLPLLSYTAARANTKSFMVFHRPFLNVLAAKFADADFLLGKPQPLQALQQFFIELERDRAQKILKQDNSQVLSRIKWLIDSPERCAQYLGVAKDQQQCFQIALEIDIGLHRGGFAAPADMRSTLQLFSDNSEYLQFAGFMGYEAHIASAPLASRQKMQDIAKQTMQRYGEFISFVKNNFPQLWREDLCINTGGTQTYQLYKDLHTANDMCIASGLLKPTDFDLKTTSGCEPCLFIASPVLKTLPRTTIPFLEPFAELLSKIIPAWRHSVFIYGGYWKAKPHSPRGLANNQLYARSTNQEMLNLARGELQVDDYVFLRPTQSESVMLQFDNIILFRSGEYVGEWAPISIRPSSAQLNTARNV